jgi:hypothetical protein
MTKKKSSNDFQTSASEEALGFVKYALEFYRAAMEVDDTLGTTPGYEILAPITVLYLTGHSIELIIKAFLINQGCSDRELKNLGHNLEACLKKAKELKLHHKIDLNNNDEEMIRIMNITYSKKELEYFKKGQKEYPIFGPLSDTAKKLLDQTSKLLNYPDQS